MDPHKMKIIFGEILVIDKKKKTTATVTATSAVAKNTDLCCY